MAVTVSTVAPGPPRYPEPIVVVGDYAITAGQGGSGARTFSVLDIPAKTQQLYSVTPSGGHSLTYTQDRGHAYGGAAYVAFAGSSNEFQMVRYFPDGTYDCFPTIYSGMYPKCAKVGSVLWVFSNNLPRVFDLATSTWGPTPTLPSGYTVWYGQVYSPATGLIYLWSSSKVLSTIDPITGAQTTIGTFADYSQCRSPVVIGSKIYWTGVDSSFSNIIELDTSTNTVTIYASGMYWYTSLCLGSDGRLYGYNSNASYLNSWNPTTHVGSSDATGLASGIGPVLMTVAHGSQIITAGPNP